MPARRCEHAGRVRKRGMALITVFFFSVLLTALSLLVLTVLSRRQEEILRLRHMVRAENVAQSGSALFWHKWKTDGIPPAGFQLDLKDDKCVVEVAREGELLTVVSTGKVKVGRIMYERKLSKTIRIQHPTHF